MYPSTHRPGAPVTTETVEERPTAAARLGQVLILAAGALLLVVGLVTVVRIGFDSGLTTPVTEVLGFRHALWLGIAELVVGVALVAAGASAWDRSAAVVLGTILVVLGALLAIDPTLFPDRLALDGGYGWFLVLVGAAALAGGLLPGGWVARRRHHLR